MWLIENAKGAVYDEKERRLKTIGGEYLASVEITQNGFLEIWLGMDTNFKSDDGKIHALGWNGCEEHMGDRIRLDRGGGILEYQEDRHSLFRGPGKTIKIKVAFLEGNLVAIRKYKDPPTKSYLKAIIDSIRTTFALRKNAA